MASAVAAAFLYTAVNGFVNTIRSCDCGYAKLSFGTSVRVGGKGGALRKVLTFPLIPVKSLIGKRVAKSGAAGSLNQMAANAGPVLPGWRGAASRGLLGLGRLKWVWKKACTQPTVPCPVKGKMPDKPFIMNGTWKGFPIRISLRLRANFRLRKYVVEDHNVRPPCRVWAPGGPHGRGGLLR